MVWNTATSDTHGHGPGDSPDGVRWGTPAARWILVATVFGSGIALLDVTVVNVAEMLFRGVLTPAHSTRSTGATAAR